PVRAAVSNGPVPATGTLPRFQNRAFEPCFPEFVRSDHSRDPRTQDDHRLPFSQIAWQASESICLGLREQPERLHCGEGSPVPACSRNPGDKVSPPHTHPCVNFQQSWNTRRQTIAFVLSTPGGADPLPTQNSKEIAETRRTMLAVLQPV